jgi:hypothetical protein
VEVINDLSKDIETLQRCFNILSGRSYQSFLYALGEEDLPPSVSMGVLRALPLGGGGSISLGKPFFLPSTHSHLEVGGGLHHSLRLEGSPGSLAASLALW